MYSNQLPLFSAGPCNEEARAVSERDDRLLAEKMEKLAKEAEEDSGSEEDEDETMGDIDIEKQGAALQM